MTFIEQSKGTNPAGDLVGIPVGGTVYTYTSPLAANVSTNTGWISTAGYGALLYIIRSDQISAIGGITVEYSDDGINPIPGGGSLSYTSAQAGMQIQRVLVPKAKYTRISYTNGTTAQTTFRLEVKLSTTLIQPTEGSHNLPVTESALGLYVISDIQATDGTSYERIFRTGNALNVSLPSPANATTNQLTTTTTVSTVLAANPNRRGAIFNSASGTILIKLGAGASASSYSARLVTNGYYELPPCGYTGIVTAIGAGTLIVTEITA